MNKLNILLSIGTLSLLASASPLFAADIDPGYGPGAASMKGANGRSANRYAPQYFRPTQRFYGKGYTVTYRFIPWSDRMRGLIAASTWDVEQAHLPTNVATSFYANGNTPRITYFYKKPTASPLGLPESNSSIATTPNPVPPIGEAPAKQ